MDTLAYLCVHWQKLVENTQKNIVSKIAVKLNAPFFVIKVTLDKLAVKLGPIVLGQATQSSECQALLQQLDLHGDRQFIAKQKCAINQQEAKNKCDIMVSI